MGAWGVLPFENDAALDWVGELESEGASAIDKHWREPREATTPTPMMRRRSAACSE